MKTIGQILHHKTFPLQIMDSNANLIYFEYSYGAWQQRRFDDNGNLIWYEDSCGHMEDNRS